MKAHLVDATRAVLARIHLLGAELNLFLAVLACKISFIQSLQLH
jgi:hypothetical protein